MSTPSPQIHGALDGASSPKSRVRITVLTILAVHVVFIGGLLLQGCKEGSRSGSAGAPSNTVSTLPPLTDTNYFTSFPGDTPAAAAQPAADAGAGTLPPVPPALPPPQPAFPDAAAPLAAGGGFGPPPTLPAGFGPTTEHVIKRGDTIGALAKKYGVTEQAILDANPNAKPRSLQLNQRLVIPSPTATGTGAVAAVAAAGEGRAAGAPAEGEVYVVRQGDNLTKIANRYGVSVKQLRAANNIKGDRILPKQRLVIPAKPAAPATTNDGSSGTF